MVDHFVPRVQPSGRITTTAAALATLTPAATGAEALVASAFLHRRCLEVSGVKREVSRVTGSEWSKMDIRMSSPHPNALHPTGVRLRCCIRQAVPTMVFVFMSINLGEHGASFNANSTVLYKRLPASIRIGLSVCTLHKLPVGVD